MSLRLHSLSLLSLGLVLFACDNTEEPNNVAVGHADAALLAQTNTERALRGLIDSANHLTNSVTLARLLSTLGATTTTCSTSGTTTEPGTTTGTGGTAGAGDATSTTGTAGIGAAPSTEPTPIEPNCTTEYATVTVEDLGELRQEALEATTELIEYMRDTLLTEANLESDDGKISVYALGPEVFCDSSGSESVPTSPIGAGGATSIATTTAATYDADCVADLAKLSPKLVLSSPKAGDVDMKLTLTGQNLSPATFHMYSNQLGVDVDLGAIQQAANASGLTMDGVSNLTGKFTGAITANGTLDYSVELGITETIGAILGDDTAKFTVNFAASSKALFANFNGNSRRTEATSNLGRVDLLAPLGAFFSDDEENYDDSGNLVAPKSYAGNIAAALGGLTSHLVYDGATDVFAFDNVGLGGKPLVIKLDNATLMSADINASSDQTVDFSIGAGNESGPDVSFASGVDLDVVLAFSNLASQVTDLSEFLLNDKVKLLITGENSALRLEREQIRVVQGRVEVKSATYDTYDVIATTGMCLVAEEPDPAPKSLAGLFTAGTCQ